MNESMPLCAEDFDELGAPEIPKEQTEQATKLLFNQTLELSEIIKEKKALKIKLEALNEREEKLMETVLLAMEAAGTELVRFKHGSYFPIKNVYASLVDQGAGFEWLRNNDLGDLIKETVNAKTLAAVARERIENGEPVPECIKVSVVTKVGHRS